jgi:hypothetical protein
MIGTQSHDKSISDQELSKAVEMGIWDTFVKQEAPIWNAFHAFWLKAPQKVPTYFVRYEDLCQKPEETLQGLFRFLLGKEDLGEMPAKIKQAVEAN